MGMQTSMIFISLCSLVLIGCLKQIDDNGGSNQDLGTSDIGPSMPDLAPLPPNLHCDATDLDAYIRANNIRVDYKKELMITALAVVEDRCRTGWLGQDEAGAVCTTLVKTSAESRGHWTFGHLIKQAAGDTPPEEFIMNWLKTWDNDQVVNFRTVGKRKRISSILNSPWALAGFKLESAPFRLLAIVNRTDLAGLPPPYARAPLGEGRFVYGFTDSAGAPLQAIVSFEYQLSPANGQKAIWWAERWHKLASLATGGSKSAYNEELQAITDSFVNEYSTEVGPNHGSALLRVRTNELSFGDDGLWEMREYTLQDNAGSPCNSITQNQCQLRMSGLAQTPDISFNRTPMLISWVNENKLHVQQQQHFLPSIYNYMGISEPFLAGAIRLGQSPSMNAWSWPLVTGDEEVRHQFSTATCNGCHYAETGTLNSHVKERYSNTESRLSKYVDLINLTDPAAHITSDPVTGGYRGFNEPRRRACEFVRILSGREIRYSPPNNSRVVQ